MWVARVTSTGDRDRCLEVRHGALGPILLLAPLLGACARTQYEPINSPRVSSTSGGYMRDGLNYGHGFGGLADAVADNPQAHTEAKTASRLYTGGAICGGFGLAAEVGGLVLASAGSDVDERTGETTATPAVPIGFAIFAAGVALSVTGIVLLAHSNTHAIDAMNIYNDGVELKRAPVPAPPGPGPRIDAVPVAPVSAPAVDGR